MRHGVALSAQAEPRMQSASACHQSCGHATCFMPATCLPVYQSARGTGGAQPSVLHRVIARRRTHIRTRRSSGCILKVGLARGEPASSAVRGQETRTRDEDKRVHPPPQHPPAASDTRRVCPRRVHASYARVVCTRRVLAGCNHLGLGAAPSALALGPAHHAPARVARRRHLPS